MTDAVNLVDRAVYRGGRDSWASMTDAVNLGVRAVQGQQKRFMSQHDRCCESWG
jgi:hypothetical protein